MTQMHQSRVCVSFGLFLLTVTLSWSHTGAERRGEGLDRARMMLDEPALGTSNAVPQVQEGISEANAQEAFEDTEEQIDKQASSNGNTDEYEWDDATLEQYFNKRKGAKGYFNRKQMQLLGASDEMLSDKEQFFLKDILAIHDALD
eukprot:TRINITY_DN17046_c0_g1_i1.p1 TRINITY_DN17046_c0_g1~~TRINITY_DN17046_c0_g1_i1.p1  ORF type:complete len:146 (+),score=20.36 TRINITY_DN17046_c0_g1_i1:104-541(+)